MINFQILFKHSPNPYLVLNRDLILIEANEAYLKLTGKRRDELVGRRLFDVFPHPPTEGAGSTAALLEASLKRVLTEQMPDTLALLPVTLGRSHSGDDEGEQRYWSLTHTPIPDELGEVALILQSVVDVTGLQRQASEEAEGEEQPDGSGAKAEAGVFRRAKKVQERNQRLELERRHLRRLFDQAPGFIVVLRGPKHIFELANSGYYQLIGHREIIGKSVEEALPEVKEQGFIDLLDRVYTTGEPFIGREVRVLLESTPGAPPREIYVDFIYQPIFNEDGNVSGIFVVGHDVTAQKQAVEQLRHYQDRLDELVQERTRALHESQAALQQAQKMEAVGQLTGGVAHDFNNLLLVIGGNLQLLQQELPKSARAQSRLAMALDAVERGAKLSTHLLAFARRQPLEPRVINLNRMVRDMDELLRRTLGESIEIETIIGGGLWNTFADRHQLENVVLNLALNARDAMQGVGKLTIETGNTMLDEHYAQQHAEVTAGQYVMLAVSDTGSGMSPEVIERAFEPFFTTKPEGYGTGLGLSMAYGFVKQSGGHIKIYSEVGHGTTIKIYLPRTFQKEVVVKEVQDAPPKGGGETILVVEDDEAVRNTVVEMLRELGYRVLRAPDGESALAIIQSGVPIDLLFTDVVMPGPLRSPELARLAKDLLPDIEVLFTSGYTENAIVHGGRLDPGVSLLSKPYRREDLARKVRQLLNNRAQRLAPGEASGSSRPASKVSLKVLVVEDDPSLRLLICDLMDELGHEAVAVATGEEGIAVAEREVFQVLFTDVTLPGITGVELAHTLVKRDPGLHVIFASGHGRIPETGEGEPFAGAHYLPKPFGPEDIEKLFEQILSP